MAPLLWLSIGLPLIAAAIVRVTPRRTGGVAAVGAALSAIPPWWLLVRAAGGERSASTFEWLPAGGLEAGVRLDGLSAAMTASVATVGLVVLVYAGGYFAEDPRRRSALAALLGFLAAMQGLVLADGYLTLLVFWELVGVASARLIAYSREDPTAPAAAVRAFLTTRTADVGFYLAAIALFSATGSLAFAGERPDGALGVIVAIGLVVAAMGKSAQVPLQTWLSAAMAGPTPVSALLHSATMVAAGVYLLVRSYELLAGWPLQVVGWIGAITAVAGAFIAFGQTDLKRILAGSTTSQLGLMFVGAAAGGPAVAIFHLVAHAAGKAGLFLAAGIFQHARGTTALEGLRGAGHDDRVAFAGFTVNALSIAAVPPLAAFWSKEHIAAAAEPTTAWFVLVLIAAGGSAAYLLRPWLVLAADGRRTRVARRGRAPMLVGLGAATLGSIALGIAGGPLADLLDRPDLPTSTAALVLSVVAVVLGAAAAIARPRVPRGLAEAARHELYTNDVLRLVVQRPLLAISRGADVFDRRVLDAFVDGVARLAVRAARAANWVERRGVDAAVDGIARVVGASGDDLRRLQSGRLYEYLRDAVLGGAAVGAVLALSALI
jgi:NADH-quinone oxidoreductase subunit L